MQKFIISICLTLAAWGRFSRDAFGEPIASEGLGLLTQSATEAKANYQRIVTASGEATILQGDTWETMKPVARVSFMENVPERKYSFTWHGEERIREGVYSRHLGWQTAQDASETWQDRNFWDSYETPNFGEVFRFSDVVLIEKEFGPPLWGILHGIRFIPEWEKGGFRQASGTIKRPEPDLLSIQARFPGVEYQLLCELEKAGSVRSATYTFYMEELGTDLPAERVLIEKANLILAGIWTPVNTKISVFVGAGRGSDFYAPCNEIRFDTLDLNPDLSGVTFDVRLLNPQPGQVFIHAGTQKEIPWEETLSWKGAVAE